MLTNGISSAFESRPDRLNKAFDSFTVEGFFVMSYFTYILYSKSLDKFYKGSTHDISDRLSRHNGGREKATKSGVRRSKSIIVTTCSFTTFLSSKWWISKYTIKIFHAFPNIHLCQVQYV